MKTDFSKLTDDEINVMVAKDLSLDYRRDPLGSGIVVNGLNGWSRTFNPCCCWYDAGQLIEKYRISLNNLGDSWEASIETDHFQDESGEYTIFHCDESSLRAALFVFLKSRRQA